MNEEKEHSQYRHLLRRMLYPTAIFAILIGLAITFRNMSKLSDKPPPHNTPTVSLVDFSEVISDSVAYELTPTTEGSSSSVHPLPQAQTGGGMASYPPPPTSPPSYPGPGQGMVVYPTATPYKAPLCKFPLVDKDTFEEKESLLDRFVFSKPEPTLKRESSIYISQWLPDNQRVLIARGISEKGTWYVETFNISTGKTHKYGEGMLSGSNNPAARLIWLEREQAVSFITIDKRGSLFLGYGEEKGAEHILSGMTSANSSLHPNGQDLVFFHEEMPDTPQYFNVSNLRTMKMEFKKIPVLFKDPEYRNYWDLYRLIWHPQGKYLAYYNMHAFYLADTKTGEICELDLTRNQWAATAHWSPNGHYLAVFNTVGEPNVPYIGLTVIDMYTGKHIPIELPESGNKYSMTWHPNSRNLIVFAGNIQDDYNYDLYVVDVMTAQARRILKEYPFSSSGYRGIDWSPDGEMIALGCDKKDVHTPDELCIIKVEVR